MKRMFGCCFVLTFLCLVSYAVIAQRGTPTLINGEQRIALKYSTPDMRGSGMFSNPLSHKVRYALRGKQAELRITNTSPIFEVSLPGNAHPSEIVQLVKFDVKSDRREIEMLRVGVTGTKSGLSKDRMIEIAIEELPDQGNGYQKPFRIKLNKPMVSGEYALVIQGHTFYDFGVDAAK